MSNGETVSGWESASALYVMLAVILFSLLNYFKGDSLCRWLSAVQQFSTTKPAVKLEEVKKQLFVGLGREVSHDPLLREKGAIRILEIGVGTGSNFTYYPPDTHLVVVDPNPNFASYYHANRDKFSHIHCEKLITTTGERMDMVPDNSVDVVVMTLVLCTIEDPCKILQQIIRVLVKRDVVVMTLVLCTIEDPCKILQQIIRVLVKRYKNNNADYPKLQVRE
ncbi:thiol S-methyltransferase METTL7B-like [Penaeus chinensis]|uniref:thiol S-methyltransferase METTL7B-like n=1 Tax=Penaeus chinensis TaxID=139456 RepID=UPI001FB5FC88|nr:thiol S-methyltransferase METTL7B-like [Penaeus chinensis]